ncbi:MAG: thermonuclease family protein [Alphaproteobacteria bacterium]|nr:thermonuclease family protein [Alphaproteobacteria bacterium]NNF25479.1 thermonuclease family protein [Paracoccaceae bacterium]
MGLFRLLFNTYCARAAQQTVQRRTHQTRLVVVAGTNAPATLPAMPASGFLRSKCHVIDGDTIVIARTKIRLAGIDAPELDQPWGQKSKWAMVAICKGEVITAELNGERSYDRLVGSCYLPDGRDIAAELVKQGLALDWPAFSKGKYRHLEPDGARRKLWKVSHRTG